MAEFTPEGMEKIMEMFLQLSKKMDAMGDTYKNLESKMEENNKRTVERFEERNQKMMENLQKKMDENREKERRERKEYRQSWKESVNEINKNIKSWREEIREDRLKREELRKERTKEVRNDSKPEPEEIPKTKTMEPVMVLPGIKLNGNKENIKQRKRRMYPRNVIKTKEELEMMNHGLIEMCIRDSAKRPF